MASADDEGTVGLWTAGSGARRMAVHRGAVHLAFSPRSDLLASADEEGAVALWTLPDGRLRAMLRGYEQSPVSDVRFSPGGTRLLAHGPSSVRVWDVASGHLLDVLREGDHAMRGATFGDEGHVLTVDSDPAILRFDVTTSPVPAEAAGFHRWLEAIAVKR